MPLARLYEENDVSPDLRRLYGEIRLAFDLPFVPSVFKVCAGVPEYLKLMWGDLRRVVTSTEFHTAASAYDEYLRSIVIAHGWRFTHQEKLLVGQRFALEDVTVIGGLARVFGRSLEQMALFSRLMQRGYSGGQRGRVTDGKRISALARVGTVHIPNEKDAGLRTWMIYNDIKKTTGMRNVLSLFRMLSPFPGYLASMWQETKKIMSEPAFQQARDDVARRAMAMIVGLPVHDQREAARGVSPAQWRDIEELVDSVARVTPQFALISIIWQRSFPQLPAWGRAAA